MEENNQELLVVTDEDGNETKLKVLEYFFYNGEEYAVMTVADDDECECDECEDTEDTEDEAECECGDEACECCAGECASEEDVFFMKVVPLEGDEIELQPVSDELADQLMEVLEGQYDEDDEEDEDGKEEE